MKIFTKMVLLLLISVVSTKLFAKKNHLPVTESLRTNLYILNADNSTVLADGNLVQYNNAYSAGIDFLDVVKFQNINETFALERDNVLLAIERRPLITFADTVFFSLAKTVARNYQFQFTATALGHPGLSGILMDNYTGVNTSVSLNGVTAVNFSVDTSEASQNTNRFMVVFTSSGITPVHFTGISVSQQGQNAAITWNVQNELNIKQYEVERSADGNNFVRIAIIKSNSSAKYSCIDAAVVAGNYFYRIRSVGLDGALIYSQVVKLRIGAAGQSVSIFSNPVRNGIVSLQFTNMPKGNYSARLISLSGQSLIKTCFNISAETIMQNIPLNKNINKGIYQLEIIAPDRSVKVLKMLYY